jgi:2-phosphoglycerate kinase
VLTVRDGSLEFPFADVLLARTLVVTGMESGQAMDVAEDVAGRIGAGSVDVRDVRATTALVLADRGQDDVLRRLRARWWLRSTGHPLVIVVGGASGVGKSTMSDRAAQVLGIDRTFSTDLVRAILRGTLNPDLIPALSESSFSAQRMLRSNLAGNPLLMAFEQQASIVEQASLSMIRRALKEGLQLVLNGVHLVPGLVTVPEEWDLFAYVLTVPDLAEHERRFTARVATSDRDSHRYIERLAAIRELDDYIVSHSREAGIPVIESREPEQTLFDLVGAITHDLEQAFDLDLR